MEKEKVKYWMRQKPNDFQAIRITIGCTRHPLKFDYAIFMYTFFFLLQKKHTLTSQGFPLLCFFTIFASCSYTFDLTN